MKDMDFKKREESERISPKQEEIKIQGTPPKKDFVDQVFSLIIPKDNDIKYPQDSEWKNILKRFFKCK
jgi:hypothetical protein